MTTDVKPRKRWTVRAIAVAGAAWLISLKSETVEGLLVHGDERINSIDRDATLFSGMIVLLAILGAFVLEIAQGRDGQPYSALGAIGGLAYILALLWLRFRR